jgi:hypothetical protein
MHYSRGGEGFHATGRDLWVFTRRNNHWVAVWQTMFNMAEQPLKSV